MTAKDLSGTHSLVRVGFIPGMPDRPAMGAVEHRQASA